MITRVCSGFAPSGRTLYGEKFLQTFDRHWPKDVELQVYVEEAMDMPRDACRDLWSIPGAREFHVKHANNSDAQGRVPHSIWKDAERSRGYSFRHDAYKFWKQILIPQAASLDMADGDILAWMDADVITRSDVPEGFIAGLIKGSDLCYLGRGMKFSEIGFWAVRISQQSRKFLADIADAYTSGDVFGLVEWHSAFVWDHVRKTSGLAQRDLTPRGRTGHVWLDSPLYRYTDHLKGERRKQLGRSVPLV